MTLSRRDILRLAGATTALAAVGPVVPAAAAPPRHRHRRDDPRLYGVLEPDKPPLGTLDLAGEYADGLRARAVGVVWGSYETARGSFSSSYLDTVLERIDAYRTAGYGVVLDVGMQYAPSWVFTLPGSRFVNQYGDAFQPGPGDAGVNAVFNQAMRQVQQEYLAQLFAALGSDRVTSLAGIRLGWGHYGEIGYPHPTYGAHTNSYWAFDDIAQGHASGLPTGVPACPVPGWIPGTSGPTQAQAFVHWYLEALLNYQQWQITTVCAHYAGPLVVLYGSRGVRPGQIDDAVAASLNGSTAAEIDSDLQRGFDYQRLVNGITDLNVAPCTTWLDCTFGNPDDASSDPVQWTPVHYLHYLASQRGLRIWSENTGHGSYDTMALCFKRMQTFDVHALLWAFHAELYSGRYATMDQYAQLIKQYQSAGRCRRNT